MHIVEHHYLGLELKHKSLIPTLMEMANAVSGAWINAIGISDEASKNAIGKTIWHAFSDSRIENFLFTETAQEVVNNIKVTESFDVQILRVLPADQILFYNLLLGQNRVIKCIWHKDLLVSIDLTRHEEGTRTRLQCESAIIPLESSNNEFNNALKGAIQCLIFLKLTQPETIKVAAGEKYGTRKQGHYNASSLPVTIVDSTWNKYIVRTEGFGVSGHFRMQPHGKGNAELKLIWIKPFQKHGYVRLPKADPLQLGDEPTSA